jgi:hypothetical protein
MIYKKIIASAFLVCAFLGTNTVHSAEYWVKAGSSGDGKSKASPAARLQPLLASARRGDMFHVAQGEYNGRDLKGEFSIDVPELTLIGGYNDDFSIRDPFKYPAVLKRKEGVRTNYTEVVGGIIGQKPDAHKDGQVFSASGLIIDGFFLDGSSRNVYSGPGPHLAQGGSWKESLMKMTSATEFSTANMKIRNSVFVNGYYQGIYVKWQGDQNEVSNNLFVNCSIAGIDGTGALAQRSGSGGQYPETKLLVKNNTVAAFYSHDKAQLAHGFKAGGNGINRVENNVFAYLSQPASGVVRNANTSVVGNVFWFTNDAEKILRDQDISNTGASSIDDEEEEEEGESLDNVALTSGNLHQTPGFTKTMDPEFFNALTSFGIVFNKFAQEPMNKVRATLGMKARKSGGGFDGHPEYSAFMRPYPTDALSAIPLAFVSDINGKGIQLDGPFETYAPRTDWQKLPGAVAGKKVEYQEIKWEDLKGKTNASNLDGKKVKFKVGFNRNKIGSSAFKLDGINAVNYVALELRMPGSSNENVSQKIMAYTVQGSKPTERFNAYGRKQMRKKTWANGVWVRGVLHAKGRGSYPYSLVIDYIGKL